MGSARSSPPSAKGATIEQDLMFEEPTSLPNGSIASQSALPTLLTRSDRQRSGRQRNVRKHRTATQFDSLKCLFAHSPLHSCPSCVGNVRSLTVPSLRGAAFSNL